MLTWYALRLGLILVPRLPRRFAYRVCSMIGLVAWRFNAPTRANIEANMAHVLRVDAAHPRARRATQAAFRHLVTDYYDLMRIAVSSRDAVLRELEIHCLENLTAAFARGTGVVLVFFHTSGFNLAAQGVVAQDIPMWVVAEPLRPARLHDLANRLRSSLGVRLLTADGRGMRGMLRALRDNRAVLIAGDRGVTGTGVWVRFFGESAFLPAGAATLALRTGAAIVPAVIERLPDGRVSASLAPALEYRRTGDFDADVRRITGRLAAAFEPPLRARPEQWVVARSVWSDAPEEEIDLGGEPPEGGGRGSGPRR